MGSDKRGHNARTQRRNACGQFAPEPVYIEIFSDSDSESDCGSDPDSNVKLATKMTPAAKLTLVTPATKVSLATKVRFGIRDLGLQW
jgi:hypothetical protein